MVSHDVDIPAKFYFHDLWGILLRAMADVLKRRDLMQAAINVREWFRVRKQGLEADPFFNFSWIMKQSEKRGLRSQFFFICGHSGAY